MEGNLKKENNKITDKALEIFKGNAIFIVFIVIFIVISIARPDTFLTLRNLINILRQVAVVGIVSCGMTMILVSGNLDLSVGSTFSMCLIIPVLLEPYGLIVQIVVTLLAGMTVGLINGYLVGKLNANSLIITLGMLSIVQGVTFLISGGRFLLADAETTLITFGKRDILGMPFIVYVLIFIAIISHLILSKTKFGRSIYLTGSNPFAAYTSGINIGNTRMFAFIATGLFCAIGGILTVSRIGTAQPVAGVGLEFDVLTAVILGGTSLFGGKGNIFNTIIGVLLLGVVGNAMIMIGIPFSYQLVVKGAILIAAVYYDNVSNKGQR
jgi:ribose transport system permease protein